MDILENNDKMLEERKIAERRAIVQTTVDKALAEHDKAEKVVVMMTTMN